MLMTRRCEIKAGDVFGKLTVLEEVERWVYPSGGYRRQFLMQCSCGSPPKKMLISNFKTGSTLSCGCYNLEKIKTHGMHNTRQYQCWADMKTRCDSPKNKFYSYYGGRGISYDPKWSTFEGFWEDMSEGYSDDLTINRRDNNGNYCKENCKWDTKCFQGHMRRKQDGTLFNIIGCSEDGSSLMLKASIAIDKRRVHLGSYTTTEEVAEAYDCASEIHYGDRPNSTKQTREWIRERVKRFMSKEGDLRVCGSENANASLTKEQVEEISKLLDEGVLQKDIAKMFGVSSPTISGICCGRIYKEESGRPRILRKNRNP